MALVLTRKQGQTVRIGPDIVIEVGQVVGDRTKLLIHAPRSVKVLRGELPLHVDQVPAEAVEAELPQHIVMTTG